MLYVNVKSAGFNGNVSFEISAEEAEAVLGAEVSEEVAIGTNGERVSVDTSETAIWHEKRADGTYKTWPMDRADLMEKLKNKLSEEDS